jgi:hypothetical protein
MRVVAAPRQDCGLVVGGGVDVSVALVGGGGG